MAKNNQKCVRMSDEVLAYINGFPGEGFNQKFENAVAFFQKEEPRQRRKLEQLDNQVTEAEQKLQSLRKAFTEAHDFLNIIDRMRFILEQGISSGQRFLDSLN